MTVICQSCGAEMEAMEPNEFFTKERIELLATCEPCVRARESRRGYRRGSVATVPDNSHYQPPHND